MLAKRSALTVPLLHIRTVHALPQTSIDIHPLSPHGDTVVGSNIGQPNVAGEPSGDVLYSLSLASPTLVWISLCHPTTDFDTYLSVWRGCVPSGEMVMSNDDADWLECVWDQ